MKRILIASPDGVLRRMFALLLDNLGAGIDTVGDEEELKKRAVENDYTIIISQFISPFVNGYDLVARLKVKRLPRPVIYVISHINHEGLVMSLYESGIDQYITLPASITQLRRKLSNDLMKSLP